MEVEFYGVRGSVATPLLPVDIESKILRALERATPDDLQDEGTRRRFVASLPLSIGGTYGGNTTCTVLRHAGRDLVLDMGTGVRRYGQECITSRKKFPAEDPLIILATHVHWDHIQGWPFFVPAYIPGNHINFYSGRPGFKEQFLHQQLSPWCPAHFEFMRANISFTEIPVDQPVEIGPFKVTSLKLHHPDDNLGYRVEAGGASFVFLSDTEITGLKISDLKPYQEFCRGADLVYADCQYDFRGAWEKVTWGHSNLYNWLDILRGYGVKRLFCGHYDPTSNDEVVEQVLEKAKRYIRTMAPGDVPEVELVVEGRRTQLGA